MEPGAGAPRGEPAPKRERLPGAEPLRIAAEPIQDWWRRAYLGTSVLQQRFGDEARASLPGLIALETALPLEEVFAALDLAWAQIGF
ncbi:MAG: hypothetical protein M3N26_08685 [Pseudomonadota bacterium]|nr:hypothetical protein [Pseudomonadota bacterium]